MTYPGFLAKSAAAWVLLPVLWLAACPARAAIVYGNDAAYVYAGRSNFYASSTMNLGSSGGGSILFVVLGASGNPGDPDVYYGGQSMTLLAGPVSCGDGGITSYFDVYYITNPSSGGQVTVWGGVGNLGNTDWGYMWFTYGGVAASGDPIGSYSITNATQINSNSNHSQNASFYFTPSSSSSTIIEYMAFADNCGNAGRNYN
ncbi:MAG: hypothetical protein ACREKE_02490, partial [bacterium]